MQDTVLMGWPEGVTVKNYFIQKAIKLGAADLEYIQPKDYIQFISTWLCFENDCYADLSSKPNDSLPVLGVPQIDVFGVSRVCWMFC